MKLRIRKKAYDCSHHVFEDFVVTNDPFQIRNTEDYCKLGKFDNTWLAPEKKLSLCEHCNSIPIHGQIWIDNNTSYKAGDKVKIVIIKED